MPVYPTFSAFPNGTYAGQTAIAADTGYLYEWNGTSWQLLAAPGAAFSLGNLDAQAGTAQGAALVSGVLSMQSVSATEPGLVNTTTQSFAGSKTFTASSLTLGLGGTGTGNTVFTISATNNSGYGGVIVGQRNGSNSWSIGDINADIGSGSGMAAYVYGANDFYVYTNGTLGFFVDASQNATIANNLAVGGAAINSSVAINVKTAAYVLNSNATVGTDPQIIQMQNGGNETVFATENSAGNNVFPSSTAYATLIGNYSPRPVQFYTNSLLALTLDSSQNVNAANNLNVAGLAGVNGNVSTTALLTIGAGTNPLLLTTQIGVNNEFTANSAATSSVRGFQAALSTAAAAYTVSNAYSFVANQLTVGSGSAVTRLIDFFAAGATNHSASNNAAFADNNSFTGNWFINQSGTDPSIFGGVVNVKTLKFGTAGSTGSTTNILGTNGPNSTVTPNTWIAIQLSDGSTGYIPVWK